MLRRGQQWIISYLAYRDEKTSDKKWICDFYANCVWYVLQHSTWTTDIAAGFHGCSQFLYANICRGSILLVPRTRPSLFFTVHYLLSIASLASRGFVLRGFANSRGGTKNADRLPIPFNGWEHQNCSRCRRVLQAIPPDMFKELWGGGEQVPLQCFCKGKKNTKNTNFFLWGPSIRGFSLFAEGLGTKSRRKAKDDYSLTDEESIANKARICRSIKGYRAVTPCRLV
jgi:hypothetical protein